MVLHRPVETALVIGKFERPACWGEVSDSEVSCCPLDRVQVQDLFASGGGMDCTVWWVSSEMGGGIIVQCFVASGGITLQRVKA
jgi:hypothetical protein